MSQVFLLALALMGFSAVSWAAEPLISPISTTQVHRIDVVDAAAGHATIGSPVFAYRQGDVVHYFTSTEHCGAYVADPAKYPDADKGYRLALMGADPVTRFPQGVHDKTLGVVVAGDPMKYLTSYKGVDFTFTSMLHLAAFDMDPDAFIPEVGGYCLGAMSNRHITPGDPRNVFFVPEEKGGGMWAVFGSPLGPVVWAKMTPQERRQRLAAAHEYYRERMHPAAVASR